MKPDVAWPADVQAVMDRALERDAKLRYQSAAEFGRDLWMAIDRMPASALAEGGTMVMGAPPVPPTRVGAAPPAAPAAGAPVATATKSRTPMLVGGGVLAAAVVAGVFMFSRGSGTATIAAKSADSVTRTTAQTSSGVPASAATSVSPMATGPTISPTTPSRTTPAPVAPSSLAARSSSLAVVGGKTESRPDIAARLPKLLDESSTEESAAVALAAADNLLPQATTTSDIVGLYLVKAQALAMQNKDAESCAALKSVAAKASGTPYAKSVASLVANCQ
jgi:hypothetical protein